MIKKSYILGSLVALFLLNSYGLLLSTNFALKNMTISSSGSLVGDIIVAQDNAITENNAKYKWVIAVYLDGDNDAEGAALHQFNSLASLGSTDDVLFVVLFDRHPSYVDSFGNWSDTMLFIVEKGISPNVSNALENWGERNMGNGETLYDFLTYVFHNFDAEHYMLLLWNHGSSALGLSLDYTDNDKLLLGELRDAVYRAEVYSDKKLDIIGFDMCIMGVIDVAYSVMNTTDIVVFSEHWEFMPGWDYELVFSDLVNKPSMNPVEFAEAIVNKTLFMGGVKTLSAVNTTALAYAVPKINRVVAYVLRHWDSLRKTVIDVVNGTNSFPELLDINFGFQKDLIHFFKNLRSNVSDSTLIDLIDDSITSLQASVISNKHRAQYRGSEGIAAVFSGGWMDVGLNTYLNNPYAVEQSWSLLVKKLYNHTNAVWLYDLYAIGFDDNNDGFDDRYILEVDLDTEFEELNLTVVVSALSLKGTFLIVGKKNLTIYGATYSDVSNMTLDINTTGIYNLRLDVFHSGNMSLIKRYYYFFDDDSIEVKVVLNDTVPPEIDFKFPHNGSTVSGLNVRLRIHVWDVSAVKFTAVYANGSIIANFTQNQIDETVHLPYFGVYNLTAIAFDYFDNRARKTLWINVVDRDPPKIVFYNPKNNSVIYTKDITLNISIVDESPLSYTTLYLDGTIIANFTENEIVLNIALANYGMHNITAISVDEKENWGIYKVYITAIKPNKINLDTLLDHSIVILTFILLSTPIIRVIIKRIKNKR